MPRGKCGAENKAWFMDPRQAFLLKSMILYKYPFKKGAWLKFAMLNKEKDIYNAKRKQSPRFLIWTILNSTYQRVICHNFFS